MPMTPIDVRNKDFRKGVRGYNTDEVDRFLENVSQEFEIIYTENFEIKEKLLRVEGQINHYKQIENTLQQTMLLAQQTAEEVKLNARHEAELLLREAEQQKALKLAEAQKKFDEIQEDIQELLRRKELIRTQLKTFLSAQLDLANSADEDLEVS